MSQFRVERLTKQNIPAIYELLAARRQVGKHQLDDTEIRHAQQVLDSALTHPRTVIWTTIDSTGKVVGYLAQFFPKGVGKFWCMSFLATSPTMNQPWNYQKNGMDQLWQRAFSFGRYHSCPGVLWSLPAGWAVTTTRTMRTSLIWNRYHIESFATVPAGVLPEHDFDRLVFGDTVKSYDVQLRAAWPLEDSVTAAHLLSCRA